MFAGIAAGFFVCSLFVSCISTNGTEGSTDKKSSSLTLDEQTYKGVSLYVATGDPEQAISAFERAKKEAPDDPDTMVLYAALLMSAGMIDEADAELSAILGKYPEHTGALYNMALVKDVQGKPDERDALLTKILEIDPDHAKANAMMGEIYMAKEKTGLAEKSFAKSIKKDPDNLVAQMGYGNALRQNEKYEESLKALDKAAEIAPDYSFVYLDRAKTKLRLRDIKGADDDLGLAIKTDPDYYWHYIDRGKVRLIEMGDLNGAFEDFNHAVELRPDYFYAYVYRGAIYLDFWKPEKAAADLLFVYSLEPKYDRIYGQLGSALYMTGDYEQAAGFFQLLVPHRKGDYGAMLLDIVCLRKAGKKEEARKLAEELYPKIPRDHVMYHIARAYAEEGYEANAFRNMEQEKDRARKLQASFFMAELYDMTGKENLAQKLYIEVHDGNILEMDETRLANWECRRFGVE